MKTNTMSEPKDEASASEVITGLDKPLYYVRRPYANFTKEVNTRFKEKRITHIPANIFRVWISRYITLDKDSTNSQWFTFAIENDEIVAGFVFEDEAQKFEKMLDEIKNDGFPNRYRWTYDTFAI